MAKVVTLHAASVAPVIEKIATPARVRLTKRAVEDVAFDAAGRERFAWDTELKGFGVRVQASGMVTYIVQYRDIGGRTRRIALGRHGVLTAEVARKLAVQKLAEVARGENPSVQRRAARTKAKQTQTIKQLVERFLREHVDAKRKPRTAHQYRRLLETHVVDALLETHVVDALGSTAVPEVSREDIEALHLKMRATPYEANRLLAVLSKMFNMAEAWRLRPLQSNPCYRLERYPEKKRDRFYPDDELRRIGAALIRAEQTRTVHGGAIAALRLLAFTGCS